jgi:hypothetical protein
MKKCTKCQKDKELSEFGNYKKGKFGKKSYCKECAVIFGKQYRNDNTEKIKKYYQDNKTKINSRCNNYYVENNEKIKKRSKDYRINNENKIKEYILNNPDKIKIHKKNYYNKHKEHVKNYNIKYYENNQEQIKENVKHYYYKNKEQIKEKSKEYLKKYYKKNPHIVAWRRILRRYLTSKNIYKNKKTIDMLGYSADDFKKYIENLFTIGMSWENHGEWHIDHIKPICTFSDTEQPSIVNALSNLRPMWATNRKIDGIIYEGNLNRKKYGNYGKI